MPRYGAKARTHTPWRIPELSSRLLIIMASPQRQTQPLAINAIHHKIFIGQFEALTRLIPRPARDNRLGSNGGCRARAFPNGVWERGSTKFRSSFKGATFSASYNQNRTSFCHFNFDCMIIQADPNIFVLLLKKKLLREIGQDNRLIMFRKQVVIRLLYQIIYL